MLLQAGSFCTSNLSSGTTLGALQQRCPFALQQYFMIRKVGSKHLMMNILAAVHFVQYFSFAVIMSEIKPTAHKSITARHFPDEDFCEADRSLKEIIRWLTLNWNIMDCINAIILCVMFGAWIHKLWRTIFWEDSGLSGKRTTLWFVVSLHVPWQKILHTALAFMFLGLRQTAG